MAGKNYKDLSGAWGAFAVTPSDSTVFSTTRALYVGVAGNLAVQMASDIGSVTSVVFSNVPVGIFPVQVIRVLSTGTTATNIVGLY